MSASKWKVTVKGEHPKSESWIKRSAELRCEERDHCRVCLVTIPPDAGKLADPWIRVTLDGECECFCTWECLLLDAASLAVVGGDYHPNIKARYL